MSTVQHLHTSLIEISGRGVIQDVLTKSGLKLGILPPSVQVEHKNAGAWLHENALMKVRRFRGSMCLSNGLVPPEAVDATGCHFLACDAMNYHMMLLEPNGRLAACMRVRFHAVGVTASGLRMFEAIRRFPPSFHASSALNEVIVQARNRQHGVAELGGWVLAPGFRETTVAQVMPVLAWALVRQLGGAVMLEHADATGETPSILRYMGAPLAYQGGRVLPVHDTHHGRLMEVLVASSSEPPQVDEAVMEDLNEVVLAAF